MAGGESRQIPVKPLGKFSQTEGNGHSHLKSTAGGLLASGSRSVNSIQ